VLTTCNRLELYWRSRSAQDDVVATGILAASLGADAEAVVGQSSWLRGDAAANHLFRVCAGLESVVMGEAEVLGQARSALEACPGAGSFLTGVFRAAVRAGRAARAETAIGEGAMSVASTAIQWLSAQMPLTGRRVLIIGAGDTARKAARHLNAIGVGALVIANRTRSRAGGLAASLNAEVVGLDALPHEIARADAVISAVSAPGWVVTLDQLRQRAQAAERGPLVLIDLSMPPSIEPGDADHVVRIDLSALEQTANANRQQREAEAPRVEVVIARELEWLRRWARREALRPMVTSLRLLDRLLVAQRDRIDGAEPES
jgi:glutamyl-tRNA reductase